MRLLLMAIGLGGGASAIKLSGFAPKIRRCSMNGGVSTATETLACIDNMSSSTAPRQTVADDARRLNTSR